jgi:hypothetical protein
LIENSFTISFCKDFWSSGESHFEADLVFSHCRSYGSPFCSPFGPGRCPSLALSIAWFHIHFHSIIYFKTRSPKSPQLEPNRPLLKINGKGEFFYKKCFKEGWLRCQHPCGQLDRSDLVKELIKNLPKCPRSPQSCFEFLKRFYHCLINVKCLGEGVVVKKSEWFLLDDVGILFHVLNCF